jgi:hypothetical protein
VVGDKYIYIGYKGASLVVTESRYYLKLKKAIILGLLEMPRWLQMAARYEAFPLYRQTFFETKKQPRFLHILHQMF